MYYDYVEPIKNVANHRVLAMNRGEKKSTFSQGRGIPPTASAIEKMRSKVIHMEIILN